MGVQYVVTCLTSHLDGDQVVCDTTTLTQAYLLDPSVQPNLDLLLQGGIDPSTAQVGFGGMVLLFTVGLGIGQIINVIRRLR